MDSPAFQQTRAAVHNTNGAVNYVVGTNDQCTSYLHQLINNGK